MKNKILNMLGLAKKAGRLKTGGSVLEQSVKAGHICLLLAARDASEGSRKKMRNMAAYRSIPSLEWGSKEELGKALGRGECAGAGIIDEGFGTKIRALIEADLKDMDHKEGA